MLSPTIDLRAPKVKKHFHFFIIYISPLFSQHLQCLDQGSSISEPSFSKPTLLWLARWFSLLWLVYSLHVLETKHSLPYLNFSSVGFLSTSIQSDTNRNDGIGFTVSIRGQVLILWKCMCSDLLSQHKTTASSWHVYNMNQTLPLQCLRAGQSWCFLWEANEDHRLVSCKFVTNLRRFMQEENWNYRGLVSGFHALLPTKMLYHNHQNTLFSVNHRTAGYQSCFCGSCIAF